MKPRLKGSLVILAIVLALALPGAYGANFVGTDNGGSYSAAVSAATSGAVSLNSIGSANPHFVGTDAKKVGFSKKWTVGNTFSEVGFLLRNTQSYDVTITGSKNNALKTTIATLDLAATADYIKAYGDSGTANLYKSSVDLCVDHGSADVHIETDANGIAKTTFAGLMTNTNGDNAITGSSINTHAYYNGGSTKASTGNARVHVDDGTLTGFSEVAESTVFGALVGQTIDSAFGDYLLITAANSKTASGKNKAASVSTEIYDGYVNNFANEVNDNWPYVPAGMAHQDFSEAGTNGNVPRSIKQEWINALSIKNVYTESSKNLKIQAEQDAAVSGPGTLVTYASDIQDPSVTQSVSDAYAGNPMSNNGGVDLTGYYKKITGSLTGQMWSSTSVTDGELKTFSGEASDHVYAGEFGTKNTFASAQGTAIYLDNKYTDNKKGFKEAKVTAYDPAAVLDNGVLTGTITNAVGSASSDGTTQDVRVQGETSGLDVTVDAYKYYNQHQTASYLASSTWYNYFLGYVDDPVAEVGHLVGSSETIQNALDQAPNTNGVDQNIFLRDTTYTGTGNKDIVNNIVGAGKVTGEKSFTMLGAGSYLKYYTGFAPNSVIDNQGVAGHRLFDLTSGVASQTFNFKNIDFNNGNVAGNGGAILIVAPGATFTSTTNIDKSSFSNNVGYGYGGAISVDSGTLHITNTDFTANHVSAAGGAIVSFSGIVTVDGGKFKDNYASNGFAGGAIAQTDGFGTVAPSLTVTGATFENNHAGWLGGAIASEHHAGTTVPYLKVTGSTFNSNTARDNGGAIAAYSRVATGSTTNIITNDNFNNNVANGGVYAPPDGLGSAIYIQGVSTSTITPNSFSDNLPTGHDIDIVP